MSADEGEQVEKGNLQMRWVGVVWDGMDLGVGVGDDECGGVEAAPLQRLPSYVGSTVCQQR